MHKRSPIPFSCFESFFSAFYCVMDLKRKTVCGVVVHKFARCVLMGFHLQLFITKIEFGICVPSHNFLHLKVTKFIILLQHGCGSINPFSVPHNDLPLLKPLLCVSSLVLGCTKCAVNPYEGILNYW